MIYRRVLKYYRPDVPKTLVGLLLSLVGIGLNLLKPWPFKYIVDNVLRSPNSSQYSLPHFQLLNPSKSPVFSAAAIVTVLCLSLIVIHVAWALFNWITNYIFLKIGLEALLRIR